MVKKSSLKEFILMNSSSLLRFLMRHTHRKKIFFIFFRNITSFLCNPFSLKDWNWNEIKNRGWQLQNTKFIEVNFVAFVLFFFLYLKHKKEYAIVSGLIFVATEWVRYRKTSQPKKEGSTKTLIFPSCKMIILIRTFN